MSAPFRVLFAAASLETGGVERQLVHYLRHLDRTRFAPGLYLTHRRGPLLADVPADVPIFAFSDRPPPRLYWPGRIHRRQIDDMAAAVASFRADALVAKGFHQTLVAAPAAKARPVRLVLCEENDPRRDFARHAGRFQELKKRLIRRAYLAADRIVAVSVGVRDGMAEFYSLPPEQVTVLPNFIDVDEIDRRANEPGPDLPPDRFKIVVVGRLATEKGHTYLIDAASRLTREGRVRLHVSLLGDGPLRADLEEQVKRAGLTDAFTFAGVQGNPFAWLARSDLFCLPSLNEGMPLVLLEAMASGIPIVAADCPSGPREVLAGGTFGRLVPVADPAALAEAIAAVARDPEPAKRTAAAARRRAEEEYAVPAGIARLERLLTSL